MLEWLLKMAQASGQPAEQEAAVRPCCVFPSEGELFWAMDNIPAQAAVTHFLIVGAPGSGKTISIQLYLQSIAHRFLPPAPGGLPQRLIIFDPKRDILSFLAGVGLRPPHLVTILNPFDGRSVPWDIARDITSEALAQYFAALLIPEDQKSNAPFFWQSAREVVHAVISALLALHPNDWTLRDLLNALATKERIVAITGQHPPSQLKADPFLRDTAHFPSILSTIASKIGKFKVIAALWHHAKKQEPFRVGKWLEGHGVLVLGNHPTFRESISPINSLLLQVLSAHLLTGPEVRTPRTWVVLDEFRWMQQVECIQELLNQGRSKGVSVLLGIQDIEGLKVVYGDHGANELLGQCANKTFLRVGSHPTAEWAEKHFAQKEEFEESYGVSHGPDGGSTSVNRQLQTRPLFLQGQFLGLPDPNTGLFAGIHDVPILGEPTESRELSQAVFQMLRDPDPNVPNDEPRPPADEHFEVWSPEEEARFVPSSRKSPPSPPAASCSREPSESPSHSIHSMNRDDLFGPA